MTYFRKRKPTLLMKFLMVLLVLGIIFSAYSFYTRAISKYPKDMLQFEGLSKQAGKHKKIKKIINDDIYVLHYPKTNDKLLDAWIKDNMDEVTTNYSNKFKDSTNIHKIKQEYQSTESNDRYISVKLTTIIDDVIVESQSKTVDIINRTFISGKMFKPMGQRLITSDIRENIDMNVERSDYMKLTLFDDAFENLYLNDHELEFNFNNQVFTLDLSNNNQYLSRRIGTINPNNDDILPSVYLDYGYHKDEKLIAITFDDGPHPRFAREIMDKFAAYDGHTTFFLLGSRIEHNEDVVKEMLDRGHQIANHSFNHPNFRNMKIEDIREQITKTEKALTKATGYTSKFYVRPPYGAIAEAQRKQLDVPFINWNVDLEDWLSHDPKAICKEAKETHHDGAILLMHEIYQTSVESLDCVLETLYQEGYKFVTVKELLEAKGQEVIPGEIYYRAVKK